MKLIKSIFICFIFFSAFVAFVRTANEEDDDVDSPDRVDPELQRQRVGLKTDDEVVKREEEKISHDGFSIQEKKSTS